MVFLNFLVSPSAVHGDSTVLRFERVLLNEFIPSSEDGSVTVATYGDVSDDGNVTSYDASLILQHCVHLIDLGGPDYPPYALSAADVTGYMRVTAYDASYVLRYAAGIIDHFPVEEGYIRLGQPKIALEHRVVGIGGLSRVADGTLLVPIVIDRLDGVFSGELELRFDPSAVKPVGVHIADPSSNYLVVSNVEGDRIRIAFAMAESLEGAGDIVLVEFKALGEVEGSSFSFEGVQLNEGEISVELGSGVEELVPSDFSLSQNYPNPFNARTVIEYKVPEAGYVKLGVYNTSGQLVRELVEGFVGAGRYKVVWDGRDEEGKDVASGVYLCRMEAGKFVQVRKMVLVR